MRFCSRIVSLLIVLSAVGCVSRPGAVDPLSLHHVPALNKVIAEAADESDALLQYPANWARLEQIPTAADFLSLSDFADEPLRELIAQSLQQNFSLSAQAARVEELREVVRISRANRLPALDASIDAARRKSNGFNNSTSTANNFSASLDLSYEVDIWKRLNEAQRQAQLNYQAARYGYEQAAQTLAANVGRAWYGALFAHELTDVFGRRVVSVRRNLEIVEQSYRQGITTALDVYLARSSLAQEEARLAQQQQTQLEQVATLQSLLSVYPDGDASMLTRLNMPERVEQIGLGRPVELVSRRPDLNSAWTQLLAQNAALAVAHKQRWPRLVLNASLDDSATSVGDIFDGSELLWSLASRLAQPIFQGGRLKAQEAQARQRVVQAEQEYLSQIQSAFAEVENALSNRQALATRRAAIVRADAAASAAYNLSFQQYQRGLVDYATVLQAEQRAFDARTNLLNLRFQLLINRIDLYTALGGSGARQADQVAEKS